MLAALASGANQFITYGLTNFTVLFLMREKGMTLKEVAVYYALVVAIGMGGSMFVSGRVIDRFTRRSKQAYGLVPAASLTLAIPFYFAFVWAPSWHLALLFLTPVAFCNYFYLTSAVTLVQEEVRPDQRVMSGALLLLDHELHRSRPWAHVRWRIQRFFPRNPSSSLVANGSLPARVVLRRSRLAFPGVGAGSPNESLAVGESTQ